MANEQVDKCFTALMDAADALETVAGKVAEAACQLHTLFDWDNQIPNGENSPADYPTDPTMTILAEAPELEPEPPLVTLEHVRAVLADKSRDGHTAAIRDLLAAHGGVKLSAIHPSRYPELLAAAQALGVES